MWTAPTPASPTPRARPNRAIDRAFSLTSKTRRPGPARPFFCRRLNGPFLVKGCAAFCRTGSIMAAPLSSMSDLFSELPAGLSAGLLANAKPVNLAAEANLFLAGDPGDGCYRLNAGLLKVSIASANGAERILAILGPGAIVGDMAMIDGRPRSAAGSGLRDCKLSLS